MALDTITYAAAVSRAVEDSIAYTDECISKLPKGMIYKGHVQYVVDLPVTGNQIGYVYTVSETHGEYVWTKNESEGTLEDWELIAPTLEAQNIHYVGETVVKQAVGGLSEGLSLQGMTLQEIVERLVGAYEPPTDQYHMVYYGSITNGATVSNLSVAGVVTHSKGSQNLGHQDQLGIITITTTDEVRRAIIFCAQELVNIEFLHFSDIENWTKQEIVCTDTYEGQPISKKFYVYTQDIATGRFEYLIS